MHSKMIRSLQSLRGIFAIMIYLSHFQMSPDNTRAFHAGGVMGVEFFLVLSGFVMCAGYEKVIESGKFEMGHFMLRRFIRLWPFHILCMTFFFLLHRINPLSDLICWGADLLMLQPWIPDGNIFFSGNIPSWCLGVFMLCYLTFPWLIRKWQKSPQRFLRIFMGIWLLYIIYLCMLPSDPEISGYTEIWLTRVFPPLRLFDFTLGILIWQVYMKLKDSPIQQKLHSMSGTGKTLIEILPICLLALSSCAFPYLPEKWISTSIWWLPSILTVLIYALFDRQGGLIGKFLNNHILVHFGNASFIFYLIHYLGIQTLTLIFLKLGIQMAPQIAVIVDCVTIMVITMIVNRWIYLPMTDWLWKKLKAGKSKYFKG